MRETTQLLGYVQVQVGSRLFALPVQSVRFHEGAASRSEASKNVKKPGGLFEEDGELGILVDGSASEADVEAQIASASAEAVRELSKRHLN